MSNNLNCKFMNAFSLNGIGNIPDEYIQLLAKVSNVALASLTAYHFYLKTLAADERKYIRAFPKKQEGINWLDDVTFQVFSAISDTFVPSLTANECSEERIRELMNAIHPQLLDTDLVYQVSYLLTHKKYLTTGALEFGTNKHAAEALENLSTRAEQQQLFMILKLLSTTVGSFLLTGYPAPFQTLPLWAREKTLRRFRDSSLPPLRTLYAAVKRLNCVLYYSFADRETKNPSWDVLNYDPVRNIAKSIATEEEINEAILENTIHYDYVYKNLLKKSSVLDVDLYEVDVVIIGSGCGGGVMAGELVAAGYTVLVVEKGGYFQSKEFKEWREAESMANLYDKGGLCTSEDGSVVILSGSCVGGGSTVNWSASFRTPDVVMSDWEKTGLSQFRKGGDFEESLDFAHKKFNVNTNYSYRGACEGDGDYAVNENNQLLWSGAEKLGYKPEKVPRNVKKCVDCGHCCFGCSHKSKQSTATAVLEPILLAQVKNAGETDTPSIVNGSEKKIGKLYILPDCKVTRILKKGEGYNQVAVGLEAIASIYEKGLGKKIARNLIRTRNIRVKAKITVCSAGSIYTPAILLNSGFKHDKIGAYLTLHPVLGCAGLFPKETKTNLSCGVSMGVVVKTPPINTVKLAKSDEARASAQSHGVAIETPPVHLGIFGLLLPWNSGLELKIQALSYQNNAVFIGISRDHTIQSNRVEIDNEGNPVIFYRTSNEDKQMLLAGLEAQVRMMYKAGARYIQIGHANYPMLFTNTKNSDIELEGYIHQLWQEGIVENRMSIFSAHQMSSCRMASTPQDGPTSPSGELYECRNLFIADGSVLPTSLGINPMITIEAFSHMISKNVIKKLQKMK